MADRIEATNRLEILIDKARAEHLDLVDLTVDDAVELLALLKEQDPVKPRSTPDGIFSYECECGEPFDRTAKYCPNCGRRLDWDGA